MIIKQFSYEIAEELFVQFPNYIRGVLVIQGVQNSPTSNEISNLFQKTIQQLNQELSAKTLVTNANVVAWRNAFKKLGFNSDYRPSFEALLRRGLNNPNSFRSINQLVDLGNVFSMQYHIPIGIHEFTHQTESISLRPAYGTERFTEFGTEKQEYPTIGEIILVENETEVITRRWAWRQGKHSIITLDTQAIYVNIDVLPPLTLENVKNMADEIAKNILFHCGGTSQFMYLDKNISKMHIELQYSEQKIRI
jgi:DNA/RNA-binding domain of Phe-tRNA-synthetase-like protein